MVNTFDAQVRRGPLRRDRAGQGWKPVCRPELHRHHPLCQLASKESSEEGLWRVQTPTQTSHTIRTVCLTSFS